MGDRGRWTAAAAALLLLGVAACRDAGPGGAGAGQGKRLSVVATTSLVADLARQIGGDLTEVAGLMGPGVDPHLYKASAGDVQRMARADVILYNGLHLEGKMAEVFEQMVKLGRRTVPVTRGIPPERLLEIPGFPGTHDPHVWFDVSLWSEAAGAVRDALAEADPAHGDAYRQQADLRLSRLAELDAYVKAKASEIPPERRVLVTAHDAFNYFGRAYGFEVKGLLGVSTASEAGTSDVQVLADLIAARRVPAIFVETTVPERYVEALRAAALARGHRTRIGGSLYSDALGTPGTPEGTYEGMVKHNIDAIVEALGGAAQPAEGGGR